MTDAGLDRVRRGLEPMQQAAGRELPFGREGLKSDLLNSLRFVPPARRLGRQRDSSYLRIVFWGTGRVLAVLVAVPLACACERMEQSSDPLALHPRAEAAPVGGDKLLPPGSPQIESQEGLLTNGIGMKLVMIPAGEFLMGSPPSEELRMKDERQHRVRITRSFYLSVHEVTVGQFRQFVDQTEYQTDLERDGGRGYGMDTACWKPDPGAPCSWRNPGFLQGDDHPVVNVSWNDAAAFCSWLSRKEAACYRLPTEAEWEYACRAGTTTCFFSGDSKDSLEGVANIRAGSPYPGPGFVSWSDGYRFTSPVGRFQKNPFGLYDMHGNVWEWCLDWYNPTYDSRLPAKDPKGSYSRGRRVARGGSFFYLVWTARCANRAAFRPDFSWPTIGFRVARTCPSSLQPPPEMREAQ